MVVTDEFSVKKSEENQENDGDEKQPPLLYSQFGKFMFILKQYYLLCKVFGINLTKNEDHMDNFRSFKIMK